MSDIQVSRFWAENLELLQDMLADGIVYLDFVMRGNSHRYDIMISDRPFSNDNPEDFSAWNENSICVFKVNFADVKMASIYSLWEVHSISAILTVSGHEVMIGSKVRRTGKGAYSSSAFRQQSENMLSQDLASFKQSLKTNQNEPEQEPDYLVYSNALQRSAADMQLYGIIEKDIETFHTEGDIPIERLIRDEKGNASLLEEGM